MKLRRLKWLCARVTPRHVHAAVVPAWFAAVLSTTQTTRQAAKRAWQHLQHGVPDKRVKLQRVPPGAICACHPNHNAMQSGRGHAGRRSPLLLTLHSSACVLAHPDSSAAGNRGRRSRAAAA